MEYLFLLLVGGALGFTLACWWIVKGVFIVHTRGQYEKDLDEFYHKGQQEAWRALKRKGK